MCKNIDRTTWLWGRRRLGRESGDEKVEPKGMHKHGGGIRNMINSASIQGFCKMWWISLRRQEPDPSGRSWLQGRWELKVHVVGLPHPARSRAPCLPETEGSSRGVTILTPQHLKIPNTSLFCSSALNFSLPWNNRFFFNFLKFILVTIVGGFEYFLKSRFYSFKFFPNHMN